MRRRATIILYGLIGIVTASLCFVTVTSRSQTATLSDGTVLRLQRVTYGRVHRETTLPQWSEIKRMYAQRRWSRPVAYLSEFDTMVVWFSNTGATSVNPIRISDQRIKATGASAIKPGLHFFALPGFSRRQDKILLDVDEVVSNTTITVATWTVPNPAPQRFADWTASSIPQTNSADGLTVRLPALYSKEKPAWNQPARMGERHWTRFVAADFIGKYELLHIPADNDGMGDPLFEPAHVTIFDGTGNTSKGTGHWRQFEFPTEGLDRGEHTWRLRAEFIQTESFSPGQLWTVRFPGKNPSRLDVSKKFPGGVVRISGPEDTVDGMAFVIRTTHPENLTVAAQQTRLSDGTVRQREPEIHFSDGRGYIPAGLSSSGPFTITFSVMKRYVVDFYFDPSAIPPATMQ